MGRISFSFPARVPVVTVGLLLMNGDHVVLPSVFVSELFRAIRTFESRRDAAREHQVFLETAFALGAFVRATAALRAERRVLFDGFVKQLDEVSL